MTVLVADTSALVSLAVAADSDPDPLALCLDEYSIHVPEAVVEELRETAAYDDEHGRAATRALDALDVVTPYAVDLDADFPLDDGENAAVTLANDVDAAILLCDEFNQLGLVHASLVDTRLVTTPTLLSAFVRTNRLSAASARTILDEIGAVRSWNENEYVERARSLLQDS